MALLEIAERVDSLIERVTLVDHGRKLARLHEVGQLSHVRRVEVRDEELSLLADERGQHDQLQSGGHRPEEPALLDTAAADTKIDSLRLQDPPVVQEGAIGHEVQDQVITLLARRVILVRVVDNVPGAE